MDCNTFITIILQNLSLISERLQDDITQLHILMEMNNEYVFEIINYFLQIQPEYNRVWDMVDKQYIMISNIDSTTGHYNYLLDTSNENEINITPITITNLEQFKNLYIYLENKKILNENELIWLDDSIHNAMRNNYL